MALPTAQPLTVGSLFAGIGGFDLGFERAGFEITWQVEIDPFCRRVLEKHWPHVRRYEDVRTVGSKSWADGIMADMAAAGCGDAPVCPQSYYGLEPVDVIVGGFPCQDISDAGKRAGLAGERSGLWREMRRLVGELRPRYVVVENVAGLLDLGMGAVVGDLSELGYDAEWATLSACAFGAPHTRERVFIVAYPDARQRRASGTHQAQARSADIAVDGNRDKERLSAWFATEPAMDRMVHGFPGLVDEVRPFGNAILPQEAEWIARRILEAEGVAA